MDKQQGSGNGNTKPVQSSQVSSTTTPSQDKHPILIAALNGKRK